LKEGVGPRFANGNRRSCDLRHGGEQMGFQACLFRQYVSLPGKIVCSSNIKILKLIYLQQLKTYTPSEVEKGSKF
jgi:hypothetical protein